MLYFVFCLQIEKIYLGHGHYIKNETWKEINKTTDDSKFVKDLATSVWTREKLVNRFMKNTGKNIMIPGRSPKKILTPIKKTVVEGKTGLLKKKLFLLFIFYYFFFFKNISYLIILYHK